MLVASQMKSAWQRLNTDVLGKGGLDDQSNRTVPTCFLHSFWTTREVCHTESVDLLTARYIIFVSRSFFFIWDAGNDKCIG